MGEEFSGKILHIVIAKTWGGGEQYVYDTSREIGHRGLKVFIAVDKSNTLFQQKFAAVGEVVPCDLYGGAGVGAVFALKKFVNDNDIKIVLCHSGHAMLLCEALKKLTGIKIVCFKHNALPAKKDFYHSWQRAITDAFICVSQLVYSMQTEDLPENEKKKYHLVYNGINVQKFLEHFSQKRNGNFTVGYAGRIASDKGLEILLQAFKEISKKNSEARLFLAGASEGNYLSCLKNEIGTLQLSNCVECLNHVEDMASFYNELDVLVLPSIVREAFGLVLCEALCCGIPVITSDSGAQTEIVTNGVNGVVVPAGESVALSRALLDVMNHPDEHKEMAERGRAKVLSKFSIEKCCDGLLKVFNIITARN